MPCSVFIFLREMTRRRGASCKWNNSKGKFFLEIEKNSKRNEFNRHLLSASLVLAIMLNGKNTR